MRSTTLHSLAAILSWALLTAPPAGAAADPIDDAVRDTDSGRLRFSFPARDGVTGDGHTISIRSGSRTSWQRWNRSGSRGDWCDPCDLQVTLTIRDHDVRRVRWRVGVNDWDQRDDLQDLGRLDATTARDHLLRLVQEKDDRVAEEALEAAVLSAAGVPWQQLLALARDDDRSRSVRSTALFWLGQEAQEVVTEELEDFVADDIEDREVREAAVFALSQRPESESIPSLKRIASQHRDAEIRRTALFWLAQKDAPEVLDFFEEILAGSGSR